MKLTLGKKLGLGFGAVLALMVLSSTMTYVKSSDIKQSQDKALDVRFPSLKAAVKLLGDVNQSQSKGRQVILAGAQTDRREAARKIFDANWGTIDKDVAEMEELAPHWSLQANRDRLGEIKKQLPQLRAVQETAMSHAVGGERDAVVNAGNEFTDKATTFAEAIKTTATALEESMVTLLDNNKEDIRAGTRSLNLTMALTTFLALGIGIGVALFLSRNIAGATQSVLLQAEAIAAGDLTRDDLKVRSQDELGDLTTAINKMSGNLKQMIVSISENADHVTTASEELSATSQQITSNSEETSTQAQVVSSASEQVNKNLQTVATGSEEMSASIKEIAKNAHESAKVATGAVKVAEETNQIVGKLGESSIEIGQVVKVITSIAQQTNLLALNATIEPLAPGKPARDLRWWPTRSRNWPNRRQKRRRTSAVRSRPSRVTPRTLLAPSARSAR